MMSLLLAYDGHCNYCEEVASAAAMVTGNQLQVKSLSSKFVSDLISADRKFRAHRPVLIEIIDNRPRVFYGMSLSLKLFREFGAKTSINILKEIGKVGRRDISGLSRRPFLASVLGAGVVISASISLGAKSASASVESESWLSTDGAESVDMPEGDVRRLLIDYKSSSNGKKMAAARSALQESSAAPKLAARSADVNKLLNPKGMIHSKQDGSELVSVCDVTRDSLLVRYELRRSEKTIDFMTKLFAFSNFNSDGIPESMTLVFESDRNATTNVDIKALKAAGAESIDAHVGAKCTAKNCNRKRRCYRCDCASRSVKCVSKCCAGCTNLCSQAGPIAPLVCVTCAVLRCGWCVSSKKCCYGGIGCVRYNSHVC